MEKMRKPFQGVWNIVRFNWQFYVWALLVILLLLLLTRFTSSTIGIYLLVLSSLVFLPMSVSLGVSFYVYDLSDLYKFNWINNSTKDAHCLLININAGFDETSILLKEKFPDPALVVFDFYNLKKHTEVSIKRARKAYPPFPNTISVTTTNLPLADNSADQIFLIFAAHEIRDEQERINFFRELKRIVKPAGQIIVTEHLRNVTNFLAYNIGFLHFYSKATWLKIFQSAELSLKTEQKITPFISTFTVTKYGATS
jgi:SAM-dependent methyltransferase